MPMYRTYCLVGADQIIKRHECIVDDDSTAVEKAKALCGDTEVEIWQAAGYVACLRKGGLASIPNTKARAGISPGPRVEKNCRTRGARWDIVLLRTKWKHGSREQASPFLLRGGFSAEIRTEGPPRRSTFQPNSASFLTITRAVTRLRSRRA